MCMRWGNFHSNYEQRITPKLAGGMVKHWFNYKVSSRSLDGEGAEVKKLEQFVLDAYTYTEAETRMTKSASTKAFGRLKSPN